MNKNRFKKQLMLLIFFTFLCLIYLKIFSPTKVRDSNILKTMNYMNYSKKIEKSITKKKKINYDENFVEILLVSYALYYMSSDGVVKRPNIKNIAARACMSTTKLNKIFKKYNDDLFQITYRTQGKRIYTDSIILSEKLFKLIHAKKNQHRIHQKYVTHMVKTSLPKGPLATIVFYITVAHSNKNGVSTISIKKLTGILSQKYQKGMNFNDQTEILNIKRKLIDLHEQRADNKISRKEHEEKRETLLNQEQEILNKKNSYKVIKTLEFNDILEENIRHSMRALMKNDVLKKNKERIFFLNLEKEVESHIEHTDINTNNIENSTTNNLSYRKEKGSKIELFSKSQILNQANFKKFLAPYGRTKILLAKTLKSFKEKTYCKARKYFQNNKWLASKTFFCQKLTEGMRDFLRENVKSRSQFHLLSRHLSFFSFHKKIDLAILLFENLKYFIRGENLFEINWDNFKFFNELKELYHLSTLRS